ncbi:MAG TPA: hypothetical protein VK186_21225 [Candidatus Deferrimicrobium sp.]|nr:hypothetical protein [Candidatus Deferrimicrobium sp.]
MVIKKKLSKMFYFFVFLAVILILTGGVTPIASQNSDEDALKIIRTQGTAGMQLQGGKTIVVKDNKLFVQSGKEIRSLFPENPYLTINTNDSKLTNNDMQRLALEGMKAQFADLYNQSYRIHSSYELKGEQGNEKTVVCHFVFEHKNIWYAEERTLELDILSMGNTHTLKMARIPNLTMKPSALMKPGLKTPTAASRLKMAQPVKVTEFPAAKQENFKLNTTLTDQALSKYQTYQTLPVYKILAEFKIPPIYLIPTAKGLANTAYPEVVSAEEATNQVHILMQFALGSANKLIGPDQSSKSNVLNYLRNDDNLVAWNNIGHGGPSTLYQNGTDITAGDLSSVTLPLFKGLNGCVCLINSCQTFHDPLKAAILQHNPRVYIAGVLNLPMVTSEGSNPNFWFKTLFQHKPMSVAYTETNNESGLNGYWGYWGYNGAF